MQADSPRHNRGLTLKIRFEILLCRESFIYEEALTLKNATRNGYGKPN